MKKIFALLLVMAMLLPMVLVVNAEDEFTVEPFYVLNFDKIAEGQFDNVFDAPFFWTSERVGLVISWNGANTPEGLAVKVKELFDTRPKGARYIKFIPTGPYLRAYTENYVYMDEGVAKLKEFTEAFFKAYKDLGGELDGLFLDIEIVDMNSYYLGLDSKDDPMIYSKIVNDPRYATQIRPLLAERGFRFWTNVGEYTPEIYTISTSMGSTYATERAIWDRVMRNRLAMAANEAVTEPMLRYFPDALISDYQSADRGGWHKFLSDTGDNSYGELTASGGNSMKVGNTSNHNVYHSRPSAKFYTDSYGNEVYKNPYGYNQAIYEKSAFNMTLWELNNFKNIYASTDNKKISAWLTSYNYGIKEGDVTAYTPYTTEIVYHLGMLNPTPFLAYIIDSEVPDVPYLDRLEVVSQQLHELTRVAGFSDRKAIEVPANWNESFILSGMYAGGRNIWRITPDINAVSVADFKVAGTTDPTFYVDGKTITFPGGKIIEDSKIDAVGSCGYWVETSKDVTPIVTADADRFEKVPSLLYDFEGCTEGVFDYNYNNEHMGTWEFKWNKKIDSATNIVNNNGNMAVAINGDVTLKNVLLPENITAGDSYAKNQAWQVTVTIPEGLSVEAEINLLQFAGTKQAVNDGGFKVQGGKLYYATLGAPNEEGKAQLEYKELADMPAGTYFLRRDMNMSAAEEFFCTYYVFDANGALIASAKNVAVPTFKAITSIGFVTKAADKAILLDNYQITLTGKAADFEIYNARTGIQITETNVLQSENVAYRLSWLNATAQEETATVMADIYDGETLVETKVIKDVKMIPGNDGVETGIVEVPEGKTLYVYLKTPEKPNEEPPAEEPTDEKDGLSIGTIALVAAAVAAVVVLVVLVVTKPKAKPNTAPTEEKTEE